LKKKQSNHF